MENTITILQTAADVAYKVCTKCGESKPHTEGFFRHTKDTPHQVKTHYLKPQCRECDKQQTLAWREANPRGHKRASLKRKYGITLEQYDEMLEAQNGQCLICEKSQPNNDGFLCVDHDHSTKEVRGLLCRKCNLALGNFLDSADLLKKALEYLNEQ